MKKNKALGKLEVKKGNFFDLEGRIINASPVVFRTIKIAADLRDISKDIDIIYKTDLIKRIHKTSPRNADYYVIGELLPESCLGLNMSEQIWYAPVLYLKNRMIKRRSKQRESD